MAAAHKLIGPLKRMEKVTLSTAAETEREHKDTSISGGRNCKKTASTKRTSTNYNPEH
jgi:hypothetical protein